MDFGINLATAADSWKVVKRAEALGYTRAWFYDTQMLNDDMFVAMGAAAVHTSKIRLATGVLIPSNRVAPGHGARPGEARRHEGIHPRRAAAVSRRHFGVDVRGPAPKDPLPQPGARRLQH